MAKTKNRNTKSKIYEFDETQNKKSHEEMRDNSLYEKSDTSYLEIECANLVNIYYIKIIIII